jgi:Protein of unknown function (DUF3450)
MKPHGRPFLAVLFLAPILVTQARAADLQVALDERKAINQEAIASQKRIDEISDDSEAMLIEYRSAMKQLDSLNIYNGQMRELIAGQDDELESLQRQVDGVELVSRAVAPLMTEMIAYLEAFVGLDVPFLMEERTRRVADLKAMMARADVTNSEKYRRIMEAYEIESEYGRTIEAYRGTVDTTGEPRTVDFLRVGRVALVYQTLDGTEAGAWNQREGRWDSLGSEYLTGIKQGLRVARKQSAPELIEIPVPLPEPAGEAS